jgi:hypothetical protein
VCCVGGHGVCVVVGAGGCGVVCMWMFVCIIDIFIYLYIYYIYGSHKPTHTTYQNQPQTNRWTIFRGDKVEVINGPEKGKQGTVLKVLRAQNRVVIEGVNVVRGCVTMGGWGSGCERECVCMCVCMYVCACVLDDDRTDPIPSLHSPIPTPTYNTYHQTQRRRTQKPEPTNPPR